MNKNFLKIIVALIIFLLPTLSYSITLDNLNNILIKNNIYGEFIQTKTIEGFTKPIVTSGNFIIKDKVLYWDTVKPRNNSIKIDGTGMYSKKDNNWIKIKSEYDKSLFLDIVNLNLDKINNIFKMEISGKEDNWVLSLTPKKNIVGKIFKEIKINGNKYVNKINIIESNGDLTNMEFLKVYNK